MALVRGQVLDDERARRSAALHEPTSGPDSIRLAAFAGIVSLVPGIAGVLIDRMWNFPGTGATASEIASFAGAHRSALLIAMFLTTIAVVLWLVFGVGVWLWVREACGGDGLLSTCFLLGFVSFVTLLLAGFAVFFVFVYRAPNAPDPHLLYDLSFGLLAMSGVPTALALGSYAALAFDNSYLPTWTGWIAVVAALAHLVLFASLAITSGFFSLEGEVTIAIPSLLFAWILATGIAMNMAGRPAA